MTRLWKGAKRCSKCHVVYGYFDKCPICNPEELNKK
jgi:hypothetical protein